MITSIATEPNGATASRQSFVWIQTRDLFALVGDTIIVRLKQNSSQSFPNNEATSWRKKENDKENPVARSKEKKGRRFPTTMFLKFNSSRSFLSYRFIILFTILYQMGQKHSTSSPENEKYVPMSVFFSFFKSILPISLSVSMYAVKSAYFTLNW